MTQHDIALRSFARQRSDDLQREAAAQRLLNSERRLLRRHLAEFLVRLAGWLEPSLHPSETPLRPAKR